MIAFSLRFFPAVYLTVLLHSATAQVATISSDKDWQLQLAVIKNSPEADVIIRIGDADNLGFGWPDQFDPFCARMTDAHAYPWEPQAGDLPGLDRILLSSAYRPDKGSPCGSDGYSSSYDPARTKPASLKLPLESLKNTEITNAWLQLFIDDFQAPSFCSRFVMLLNGKRYPEGEKLLNAIDQTGPVGKLISIPLKEDWFPLLKTGGQLSLLIDEINGTADGFAIDFVRLLVNRHRENSCKGSVRGYVRDKETDQPVGQAQVFLADNSYVYTNQDGAFEFRDIPAGFEVLRGTASGYVDGTATADIGQGDENAEVLILLSRGKDAQFNNQAIQVGQSITLNALLFEQGKADLNAASGAELDKLLAFMKNNAGAEIELSGHTSSEGDRAMNRSLSYKRVKACKDYLVSRGIEEGRIIAVGFGPDKPVAPNDTETGRAKNRRVEMRLTKL